MHTSTTHQKGFTLVETLVAIMVLTLSIVGPFQIVQGVLQSAYSARDQLIAAGLAQEGIEYVRLIRDSNYLYNARNGPSVTWLNGLDSGSNGANCYSVAGGSQAGNGGYKCLINPKAFTTDNQGKFLGSNSVSLCGSPGSCVGVSPLYVDSAGQYNQANSGTATRYTRTVSLTYISTTETLVTVTVTWNNHGAQSVVLTEYLQNWL